MSRIRNAIAIAGRSLAVLRSDKKLVALPVFACLASVLSAIVFAGLGFVVPGGFTAGGDDSGAIGPMLWVLVVVFYFVQALIGTYFLAALVGAADAHLKGQTPSLGDAFAIVNGRFGRIVQWAVITATVSVVLSIIRDKLGFLGDIVAGFIGGAWEVLTFLTVPVILEEDLGPIPALKRSGHLFKQTWGENLVGNLGLGLLGVVLVLPAVGLGVLAVLSGQAALIIVGGGIAVVWILCASMVMAALSGIYRAALYRFAVDGRVPTAFDGIDFEHAFRSKRKDRTDA